MEYENKKPHPFTTDEISIKTYTPDEIRLKLNDIKLHTGKVKRESLNKLAEEIEKNVETFVKLENKFRPKIPSNDTRKSVHLLGQYFSYYANFVPKKRVNKMEDSKTIDIQLNGSSVKIKDNSETATFRFTIQKSKICPTFFFQNLPWILMVYPKEAKDGPEFMVHFECRVKNGLQPWSCHVTAKLRILLSSTKNVACCHTIDHLFSSQSSECSVTLLPDYNSMGTIEDEMILELEMTADTPHGILLNKEVGIVIDENYPLCTLGMALAPALAAGAVIFIHPELAISHVIKYLLQLCKNVGIFEEGKENMFLILSEHLSGKSSFPRQDSSYFNYLILLQNVNYMTQEFEIFKEKKLILALNNTSMVVYGDADLNAAVECAIDAACKPKHKNPYAVDKIFVQENVFLKFTKILENRIQTIAFEKIEKCHIDRSKVNFTCNLEIEEPMEVEIYKKISDSDNKFDTIGSNYGTKSDYSSIDYDYRISLTPFRSIIESISFVNKTIGIGISVWSENIGLINEVVRRLETSNVWVNSYGLFSPEVPFTAFKNNGVGYFGGVEGFDEFHCTPLVTLVNDFGNRRSATIIEELNQAVIKSKNSYSAWSRYSFVKKKKIFQDIQEHVEDYINKCSSLYESLAETLGDTWKSKPSSCFTINSYNVMALKEPRGVLVIEFRRHTEKKYLKLLLTALWEGNAVILLNEATENESFYKEMSQRLPPNIFTVFSYNPSTVYTASRNKQIDGYFGVEYDTNFHDLHLNKLKQFVYLNQVTNISNSVVIIKNVWSNIGQSDFNF